jgi:hypothetical protein
MVCTSQFAGVKQNYVKSIFLESHNIHNRFGGFGQFNYHLIRGLYQIRPHDFQITLHASDTGALQSEFGSFSITASIVRFRDTRRFAFDRNTICGIA